MKRKVSFIFESQSEMKMWLEGGWGNVELGEN